MAAFNWRDHLAVHPAADLFPLMSEAELKELAKDIKKNKVRSQIVLWRDDKGTYKLIDGRNRLDALASLGWLGAPHKDNFLTIKEPGNLPFRVVTDVDPYAIALSYNVHRRHLTPEQKRELIARVLKARPELSDRQIGKMAKVDGKTVAAVRTKKESRAEIPHVETQTDTKGRKQPMKPRGKQPGRKNKPETSTENTRPQETALALNPTPEASAEARRAFYEAEEVASAGAAKQAADDDCDTPEQIWYRGLAYRAGEAAAGAAYSNWQTEYGDWSQFKVTSELVALTDQVIESWQKLKAKLSELPQDTPSQKPPAKVVA